MNRHLFIIKILRPLFIICTGGMVYYNIEILFRGYSHISMFLCGGLSFYTIGILNERPDIQPSFLTQMILGTLIITVYEFMTGLVVNLIFHLQVWDYSDMPFNFDGVICLTFSILWIFVSIYGIVLSDIINYYFLDYGQAPYYRILGRKIALPERPDAPQE